jgi:hypothetical protein
LTPKDLEMDTLTKDLKKAILTKELEKAILSDEKATLSKEKAMPNAAGSTVAY